MRHNRIVMGAVATAVVLSIFVSDHYATKGFLSAALLAAVALTAAAELCWILEKAGTPTYTSITAFGAFAVAIMPAVVQMCCRQEVSSYAPQAGVIFAYVLAAFAIAMRKGDIRGGARAVMAGTFVLVYVGLSLSFLVRLRYFPHVGEAFLLFAIGCAKVGDMGAYFVGRNIGKRLLAPRLSPKKTVEGAFGAIVTSMLLAVAFWPYVKDYAGVNLWTLLLWAVAISAAAQFGDLAESLLKRAADVKDSSGKFATMGGVLDMVDSLLLSAPVAYMLALIGGFGGIQR